MEGKIPVTPTTRANFSGISGRRLFQINDNSGKRRENAGETSTPVHLVSDTGVAAFVPVQPGGFEQASTSRIDFFKPGGASATRTSHAGLMQTVAAVPKSADISRSYLLKTGGLGEASTEYQKDISQTGEFCMPASPFLEDFSQPSSSQCLEGSLPLVKLPSKYSPPDFISTVRYMRVKLYSAAGKTSVTSDEPPEEDYVLAKWRSELAKEPWFTSETVSFITFLVLLLKW